MGHPAEDQAAFDALASGYDAQFSNTAPGQQLRRRVYALAQLSYHPGMRVLELNCGTGHDALWFAKHGCAVTATDIAPEMVRQTAQKLSDAQHEGAGLAFTADMRHLAQVPLPFSSYHLVWSNFGGLNCLSPRDLEQLNRDLSQRITADGHFVAVVMGRWCLWEMAWFLLRGKWRRAFIRFKKGPVSVTLSAQQPPLPVWYYTPTEFCRHFPDFVVKATAPVGFWIPPSYLWPFIGRWPRWSRLLYFLERRATIAPMAHGADHFLILFEKK